MHYRPPQYLPGQRLSAADLSQITDEITRQAKFTAGPGVALTTGPNGVQIGLTDVEMWAIVTPFTSSSSAAPSSSAPTSSSSSSSKKRYVLKEAYLGPKGQFAVMVSGRQGIGYELNNADVPANTVVRAWMGNTDNEWEFFVGGSGGGGGFPARIKASAITDGVVTYEIEEIETDPVTLKPRVKTDGRSGPAYRGPTEEIDPPPIPLKQGVWATESATIAGAFEITSWGGQFRVTKERLINVEGDVVPNPSDCTTFTVALLTYFQTERTSARELCGTYAAAGEGETGGI